MEKELSKKNVPLGIKVISILGIIFSLIPIILGLNLFIGAFTGGLEDLIGLVIGPIIIIPGIMGLVLSIFLLKLKNWARITIIILLLVSLLEVLIILQSLILDFNWPIFSGLVIQVAVELAIFLYLLLNKNVKEAFS